MEKTEEDVIRKLEITEDVILNLKSLHFLTISDSEITDFIHFHCQKLLEIANPCTLTMTE